jgi:hypothetical protein
MLNLAENTLNMIGARNLAASNLPMLTTFHIYSYFSGLPRDDDEAIP